MNRAERRKKKASTQAPPQAKAFKGAGLLVSERDYHLRRVAAFRKGSMEAIRAIRSGSIDEEQLEKLQNFIQLSLALMSISPPGSLDRAKTHAELLDLAHAGNPDAEVIWDPDKLPIKHTVNND